MILSLIKAAKLFILADNLERKLQKISDIISGHSDSILDRTRLDQEKQTVRSELKSCQQSLSTALEEYEISGGQLIKNGFSLVGGASQHHLLQQEIRLLTLETLFLFPNEKFRVVFDNLEPVAVQDASQLLSLKSDASHAKSVIVDSDSHQAMIQLATRILDDTNDYLEVVQCSGNYFPILDQLHHAVTKVEKGNAHPIEFKNAHQAKAFLTLHSSKLSQTA